MSKRKVFTPDFKSRKEYTAWRKELSRKFGQGNVDVDTRKVKGGLKISRVEFTRKGRYLYQGLVKPLILTRRIIDPSHIPTQKEMITEINELPLVGAPFYAMTRFASRATKEEMAKKDLKRLYARPIGTERLGKSERKFFRKKTPTYTQLASYI